MTLSGDSTDESVELIHQVVSIVSAYVSHNAMRASELPDLIGAVHLSMRQLSKDQAAADAKPAESPAVPVKRSVSKDFIVCLECGKKFKSLRRHLSSFHSLTPDDYRSKWGLGSDYPMVAPAYSATRSQLARESGLGQISRNDADSSLAEADAGEDPAADAAPAEGARAGKAHIDESRDDDVDGVAADEARAAETADAGKTDAAEAEEAAEAPAKVAAKDTAKDTAKNTAKDVSEDGAEDAAKDPAAAEAPADADAEAPKKPKRGRPRRAAA